MQGITVNQSIMGKCSLFSGNIRNATNMEINVTGSIWKLFCVISLGARFHTTFQHCIYTHMHQHTLCLTHTHTCISTHSVSHIHTHTHTHTHPYAYTHTKTYP